MNILNIFRRKLAPRYMQCKVFHFDLMDYIMNEAQDEIDEWFNLQKSSFEISREVQTVTEFSITLTIFYYI